MTKKNIWDNIEFDKNPETTIAKILNEQSDQFADTTEGILHNKVEAVDTYIRTDTQTKDIEIGVIYNFYVYAPYLGNMRVLLFSIAEFPDKVYFIDRVNNSEKKTTSVDNLVSDIEKFILHSEVSTLLRNLYTSSKEMIQSKLE